MDVAEWAKEYAKAWEDADEDGIPALFTKDARYRSAPFREPFIGHDAIRAYWQRGAATQERTRVLVGEPVVDGSRAVVEWWATFVDPEDGEITLPGALVLRFEPDGRCSDLREYWHVEPGTHAPFPGWGS